MNKPEVKLSMLKKNNCFMYNREPYQIIRTYWENLGLIKRKIYVCRMKFENYDTHFLPDTDVYHISYGLFNSLVRIE